jgi:hypothetical protein
MSPHPDVGSRTSVPRDGDEPGRSVDARAVSTAPGCELDGQAGSTGHAKQPVAVVDAEHLMQGDVLPAVGWLAERREVHRLAAPALVHYGLVRPAGTFPDISLLAARPLQAAYLSLSIRSEHVRTRVSKTRDTPPFAAGYAATAHGG